MAGILADSVDDPRYAANMALAAGLLKGDFGGGLLGFNQALSGAQDASLKRKLLESQLSQAQTQARREQEAIDAASRKQSALPSLFRQALQISPGALAPASDGMGPVMPMNEAPRGPISFDVEGAIRAGFSPDEITKYAALRNANMDKVARTIEGRDAQGRPVTSQYDEYGRPVGQAIEQWKAPIFQNLGGRTAAIDPVSLKENASFAQTMSPEGRDASARGWAGINLQRQQAEEGKWQYDSQRGGRVNVKTGEFQPVKQDGQPIGMNEKLGEAAKKQVTGIDALGTAIDEYTKELQNFGPTSLLRPDKRAAMGTKYNNMMLQAKEAYNLGVLNGPDYSILTSIITDPVSARGAVTSNEALESQALELKRIMGKVRSAVTGQGRTSPPNQQLPAVDFGFTANAIDAELAKRKGSMRGTTGSF